MTLTTTFKRLRAAKPCKERYQLLRKSLHGVKDTEPINLLTILEINGLDDTLWALRATIQNCEKMSRLLAADYAEMALPIWEKYYPENNRPRLAIKATRDCANGLITAAAWDAAWDAASEAVWNAAGGAARAAAAWRAAARAAAAWRAAAGWGWAPAVAPAVAHAVRDAAGEAAGDAQKKILRLYLNPSMRHKSSSSAQMGHRST